MNTPKTLVASALALAFALAGCSLLPSTADTTPATSVKEMAEAPLTIQTYNPGEQAIFAVSSTLVQGKKEAVLIDAQFSAEDARKLHANPLEIAEAVDGLSEVVEAVLTGIHGGLIGRGD